MHEQQVDQYQSDQAGGPWDPTNGRPYLPRDGPWEDIGRLQGTHAPPVNEQNERHNAYH